MTSFQQFQDDNPEFDNLLSPTEPYDTPLWMTRESDYESEDQTPDSVLPLDFD